MFSLAPMRYARVFSRDKGPIERIEYSRLEVGGTVVYQSNAYLSRYLNLKRMSNQVFSGADGTGTDRSAMVARYKAVSEAMERWALYYLLQCGEDKRYGLDQDNTSTGMAAYPGLLRQQARTRARSEAAERFSLVSWWEGDLKGERLPDQGGGIEAVEIDNPASKDRMALVWRLSTHGHCAYGYAAAANLKSAIWKAVIEMERADAALGHFFMKNPGFEADDLDTLDNHMERRLVYFSMAAGREAFLQRLSRKPPPQSRPPVCPSPVVDCPMKGPWNAYATVWRVLYPMPTRDYLRRYVNTFYW